MKIFSWNVNGIRASLSKGAFQKFIAEYQPDILCLQETKAKKGQAEIDLPDYFEYWNDASRAGYSGVAVFCKEKPISILNGFEEIISEKYHLHDDKYGNPMNEGRIISVELENLWIVCVYVPNSKEDLSRLRLRHNQWDPALLQHIKQLEKTKPVVICGDFNVAHQEIDLANPKPNRGKHGFTDEERAGFENYIKAGLIDGFRQKHPSQTEAYTWWTHWGNSRARNVGWRIDYTLISDKLSKKLISANIHPEVMGSDHCPISIDLDI